MDFFEGMRALSIVFKFSIYKRDCGARVMTWCNGVSLVCLNPQVVLLYVF